MVRRVLPVVILMVIFSLDVASVEPAQDLEINMIERWGVL